MWFRGNDQTLWPPLPLGTQHKHISAHTPSKALAQYSRCSSFRRWPYWYSFSTTCFEHLRVQSSYFAIVQPLTPVHLFGYHCAAYFQRFKLGFACITYTHSRAHKCRPVFPANGMEGGRQTRKIPLVLTNVVEFIPNDSKYHNEDEILFERCPRSKNFLISAKSYGIILFYTGWRPFWIWTTARDFITSVLVKRWFDVLVLSLLFLFLSLFFLLLLFF